jgi:S-adenosylmethionine:tRNA ribosyltransferase-isomerase
MQLSDFEYDLPEELIAQYPADERTGSRLLQVTKKTITHGVFTDIVRLLVPGDLLVVNNTKVVKARLHAVKDSGGQAEILMERVLDPYSALCQVRVSKPLKVGRKLAVAGVTLTCVERQGQFYRLRSEQPFLDILEQHGHVPLPPYIGRPDSLDFDAERYQTVYSQVPGAVAAPTAGLHFSSELINQLSAAGIDIAQITLHVGAGTFQPVRGEIAAHEMHREFYCIDKTVAAQLASTKAHGGRIVAVGTTVVRALESAALIDESGSVRAGAADTRLFIKPGFCFQVVDALITNFHLPGSTLMMLVSAFAGYQEIMDAYRQAVAERYRFFSYGDAMWLERGNV